MTTPVRRQYLDIKRRYPDCVLLFRLGDFYETFDEDAKVVARDLDIALTERAFGKGPKHPLAGIPYHALDSYLGRLIKAGHKVAICEQTSDPAVSKGIVDREVVRVVTPGTVIEPSLLEERSNNYLASVVVEAEEAGLAYTDVSSSDTVFVTQVSLKDMPLELTRLAPAEAVTPQGLQGVLPDSVKAATVEDEAFRLDSSREMLKEELGVATLEGYGIEHSPLMIRAAGGLFFYLGQNQRQALERIARLRPYDLKSTMSLDPQTRRNLELFAGGDGSPNRSLC